jgi:cytochrome d ubiquinol oxidase subunit II
MELKDEALRNVVAAFGLLAVIAYGVLAGADFGGGIWDLFAGGPRREQQRAAIAKAMGPVWEANHVWLIFLIVIIFTAFPAAYAALSLGLFGLFHFVLLGISLRGAAFVFRGEQGPEGGRHWGTIFGASSVITPVLLGMVAGAVSSGHFRVVDGNVRIEGPTPWLAPVSLMIGSLALALCAYLAAVYLTIETEGELQEDFRKRGLYVGMVASALTILTLPLLFLETPHLWSNLTSPKAAPVVGGGLTAAVVSLWSLANRRFRLARVAAIAQVTLLLLGWGLAQHPFIIYPDVTLASSSAPRATLLFVVYAVPLGMAVLLPSLWLLFKVFKSPSTVEESGH